MGWKEYYQTCPESFCAHYGYGLLKRILKKPSPSPLSKKSSLRLVLGGFSPNSPTVTSFISYCNEIRPNQKDNIYLVDFNSYPFRALYLPHPTGKKRIHRIQADLTKMPFSDQGLDLIFLDSTTTFMSNSQLRQFYQEAARTLTKKGIVISFFSEPLLSFWPSLDQVRSRAVNRTQVYCRTTKDHLDKLASLKLVWHLQDGACSALVLGRQDGPYPAFSGLPYSLETINNNP